MGTLGAAAGRPQEVSGGEAVAVKTESYWRLPGGDLWICRQSLGLSSQTCSRRDGGVPSSSLFGARGAQGLVIGRAGPDP